jgi:glucose-1-phosphate cytidylyltransferase
MTGGRLKRALRHIEDDTFLMTYGDGLTDSDINASINFHRGHGGLATLTAVHPGGRFGELSLEESVITAFSEKPEQEASFINGGYFVMNRAIDDYLTGDSCILEREPLERLSAEGSLHAWKHHGFWQCMDNIREMELLNHLWESGNAPWKAW